MSLDRFLEAQDEVGWDTVWSELACGKKVTHWMWFIFPNPRGYGTSEKSKYYALQPDEIGPYVDHPLLGERLRVAINLVALARRDYGVTLEDIFGEVDAKKYLTCVETFAKLATERSWNDQDEVRESDSR